MKQSSLRLAHVTDLHLQLPQVPAPETPTATLKHLFALLKHLQHLNVDHLILTGDLIDLPETPGEYNSAMEAAYKELRDLLETANIPYTVLPGNHDHTAAFHAIFPHAKACTSLSADYQLISYCDEQNNEQIPFRSDAELNRMNELLAQETARYQIHAQHVVPYPHCAGDYAFNHQNAEQITDAYAQSNKALLSLSGHYHPGTERSELHGTTFITAPAFKNPPHPFHIYTLSGRQITLEKGSLLNL